MGLNHKYRSVARARDLYFQLVREIIVNHVCYDLYVIATDISMSRFLKVEISMLDMKLDICAQKTGVLA